MNPHEQDRFWMLYNREARPAIERACRAMSRSRTDNGMDECDMIAWVDDKVWRMLETGAWPAFHDGPAPDVAAERLRDAAGLLARWSYLGLCRNYWRHVSRHAPGASEGEVTRVERLACTRSNGERVEINEEVAADLERIRTAISERVRGRVAASWPERSERHRVALMLDASRPETDALVERSVGGEMKPNTILQMRIRSRRHIRDAIPGCATLVCVAAFVLFASAARADGEQTGGRKGRIVAPQTAAAPSANPEECITLCALSASGTKGGEQSGGRGG